MKQLSNETIKPSFIKSKFLGNRTWGEFLPNIRINFALFHHAFACMGGCGSLCIVIIITIQFGDGVGI